METDSHNKKGLGCSKGRQGLGYQQGDRAARQLHGRESLLDTQPLVSQRPLETLEKLRALRNTTWRKKWSKVAGVCRTECTDQRDCKVTWEIILVIPLFYRWGNWDLGRDDGLVICLDCLNSGLIFTTASPISLALKLEMENLFKHSLFRE